MPNSINESSSILTSIKKLLGIDEMYTVFDNDLIIHINTVIANLVQMGIGNQETGYSIEGPNDRWVDFIGDSNKLQQVKSYVYIKVKLLFDPPASSVIVDAMNRSANELEYRLYTEKGGY